ncbi:hypothetical protein OG874_00270 [Nocardia sp. NBC_00565]|uniref:hypothetical protein n=1 Tax=Nocardia sp. NBC_00565 TaxID=2975993 RepID=UPI002E8034F0|nr:hypothetical protein [Nocardia sp. NBC_00565]WUC03689.1 hypothetical protein OG874_00270 [Nocardia sp. NBC_00565]
MSADPFTAADAMDDIRQTLADNGFHILLHWSQGLIYRMPNGDRFELRVSKKRGK